MKHVNASAVLPPELLRAVQRHVTGYVYVPSAREFDMAQRKKILELRRRGLCLKEIAAEVHLGVRRVKQILTQARREAASPVERALSNSRVR